MGDLKISIVITSFTTERVSDLLELLDSVESQTYPFIETVYVAERIPELLTIVAEHVKLKSIRDVKIIFNEGEPGLSAARNLGIKQADGDITAFVDDDVILFPAWAEAIASAYDEDSIIGVTGPAFPLWEDEAMSWFPKEFYWIISCTNWTDWEKKTEVRSAWGMNMAFRSRVFKNNILFSNEYGYHKGLMAEDIEFSLRVKERMGGKIIFAPGAKVWHKVHKYRLTSSFIKERSFWIGRSRRIIKSNVKNQNKNENPLSMEYNLILRIICRLLPDIFRTFWKRPIIAWYKLKVTIISLFFVGTGYCLPQMKSIKPNKN